MSTNKPPPAAPAHDTASNSAAGSPEPAAGVPAKIDCAECWGAGKRWFHTGHDEVLMDCPDCGGTGERDEPAAGVTGGEEALVRDHQQVGEAVDALSGFLYGVALDIAEMNLGKAQRRISDAQIALRRLAGTWNTPSCHRKEK